MHGTYTIVLKLDDTFTMSTRLDKEWQGGGELLGIFYYVGLN
jgi:hypothetical protein